MSPRIQPFLPGQETPDPFAPQPADSGTSFLGYAGDAAAGLARGVEAFGQSIYQLGDLATGDRLPDYDQRFLGNSKTIGGGLVEGITEFMVGFIPVVGWIGKGAKVGRSVKLAKGLSQGAEKAAKAAGKTKKAIGIRVARDAAAGIPVDLALYGGHEERLSNLIQEAEVFGVDLSNPVTDFLAASDDDSEAVGRLKTAIEGLGLGLLADGLLTALTYHKTVARIKAENPKASSDQLDDLFDEAHPPEEVSKALDPYDPERLPNHDSPDYINGWRESERHVPIDGEIHDRATTDNVWATSKAGTARRHKYPDTPGFKKFADEADPFFKDADDQLMPLYHGTKQVVRDGTFDGSQRVKDGSGLIFFSFDHTFAQQWPVGRGGPRTRAGRTEAELKSFDYNPPKREGETDTEYWGRYYEGDAGSEGFYEHKAKNVTGDDADINVYPVYIGAKRVFDPQRDWAEIEPFLKGHPKLSGMVRGDYHKGGNWLVYENADVVKWLDEHGYDGIRIKEYSDSIAPHDTIAVWDGGLVKSAIGNDGNFDKSNPRIDRYDPSSLSGRLNTDFGNPGAEVEQFINAVGPRMFDDVGLEIGSTHGPQGSFDYAKSIVSIGKTAIDRGEVRWTTLHELWHSLSRFVPEKTKQTLQQEFERDLARATAQNPQLAEQLASGAKLSADDYRFTNFDEWFAETLTERTGPKMAQMEAASQSVFAHARMVMVEIWQAIRAKFGFGAADQALNDFMRGRFDVKVRDYGLSGAGVSKLDPSNAKDIPSQARFLQRLGMTEDQAVGIAKGVTEREQAGLPDNINPRAKDADGNYIHSREDLLSMRLEREDLNLSHYEGESGALQLIREFEDAYRAIMEESAPGLQRSVSMGQLETEHLKETAHLLNTSEQNLMARLQRKLGKDVKDIRALNNRVRAWKSITLGYANKLVKLAGKVLDPNTGTDADLVEFARQYEFMASLVAGTKGLLSEQGRGLVANKIRTLPADLENLGKNVPDPSSPPVRPDQHGPRPKQGRRLDRPARPDEQGPVQPDGTRLPNRPARPDEQGPLQPDGTRLPKRPSTVDDTLQGRGGRDRVRGWAQDVLDGYGPGGLDGLAAIVRVTEPSRNKRFWGVINEYFLNSILSGLHTLFINPVSAGMMAVYVPAEKMVGSALAGAIQVSAGASGKTHFQEVSRAYREITSLATELTSSFTEAMTLGWRAGKAQQNILDAKHAIDDISQYRAIDAKNLGLQADTLTAMSVNWMGHAIRVPSSILTGTDEFMKQIIARSKMRADLMTSALAQGSSPREAKNFAKAKLETLIKNGQAYSTQRLYDEGLAGARAQGLTDELAIEEAATAYVKENFDPSMQTLATAGINRAQDTTFTASLDINRLPAKVQRAVIEHPYLRLFIPFVRTPTNIVDNAIQRLTAPALVPIHALRSASSKAAAKRMRESGSRLAKAIASDDPQQVAEAYGRMATGAAMFTTFSGLAAAGAITGRGPSDPEQRRLLLATGWQPYSFRTAEGFIEYARMEPFATMLGTMSDITEYAKWAPVDEQETVETMVYAVATALANNFTNKTYLTGVKALVEAASQPDKKMESLGKRYASTLIPNFFAQSVVNPQDDYMKDVRTILDAVTARVPGMSDSIEPLRNVLGEPIEAKKSIFSHESEVAGFDITDAFLPVAYRATRSDLIASELRNLNHGFSPPKTTAQGTDLLEFRNARGQTAYDRFAQLHGEVKVGSFTLRQAMQRVIKSKAYQQIPIESTSEVESPRIQILGRIIRRFRREALRQTLREFPELKAEMGRIDQLQTLALSGQQ